MCIILFMLKVEIGGMEMDFDMWLYVIKKLNPSPQGCKVIYDQLDEETKQKLKAEYEASEWKQ